MKMLPTRLWLVNVCLAIGATFSGSVAFGAVAISISPPAISNTYSGMITVQITGLANGETVTLQKYLDMNWNGVVDAGDWLMQSLSLTDGLVPRLGGATNYSAPYDLTGTNGAITALLNYCRVRDSLDHFVGRHLFRVSGPSGAATNSLLVTNLPYPQLIRGTVRAAGTNVPGAAVVILDQSGMLLGGTLAGVDGNYTNRLPPGVYLVLAFKPGYVTEFTNGAAVLLTSGGTVVTNLTLTPATRLIAGRLVDAANTNVGLAGVLTFAFGIDAQRATISTTDANGYSAIPVIPGYWVLEPSAAALAALGYVGLAEESLPVIDTTLGNSTNGLMAVPKAGALLYGSIRTATGVPLQGIRFYGEDEPEEYATDATSDTNGVYAAPVIGGRCWWFNVDEYDENPVLTNYVVTSGTSVCIGSNQAVQVDFVAYPRTGSISGQVKDWTDLPLAEVTVYAWAVIGTNEFHMSTETDDAGYFWFPAIDGTWQVGVSCWDLQARGYGCVSEQSVTLPPANAEVNFVIPPVAPLQITTTNLPLGQVGFYYTVYLSATGGYPPYTWGLAPGSGPLPPGLNLYSNGEISGTPTASGTFNFTVRVTDQASSYADRGLTITVVPGVPLQITTAGLPNGQVGAYYSAWLEAVGGQPPYKWSLTPGSAPLPPGLTLSTNGNISGVPTNDGTFNFIVRVTDQLSNYVDRGLSIVVVPPFRVLTTTLPPATVGQAYTAQLQATNGTPPYLWGLQPGSGALPPGLNLYSDGTIAGVPLTNGTFNFTVGVVDASYRTATRTLSIAVALPPLEVPVLELPQRSPDGSIQLRFNTVPGATYTLLYSTNLLNWAPLITFRGSGGPVIITDSNARDAARFYRLRVER